MKKFENTVIASDLDGTYFGTKQYIVDRNLEAVKYFCENGGHFTFATGRLPLFLKKPIPYPERHINMPAVMGNGTCIYDYSRYEAIEEHFVDSNDVIEVLRYAKLLEREIGSRATFVKGVVVSDLDNPIIAGEYQRLPDFFEKYVLPIDELVRFDLHKANIMASEACIDRLYPVLKEHFSDRIGITRSASFMIEMMSKGTNKAAALKMLVDSYFDTPQKLICVGDYDNDIEMLELADVACCPSNANDRVRAVCDRCLCSNDEGVIADIVDLLDKNII